MKGYWFLGAAVLLVSACSITQNVEPVAERRILEICFEKNDKVLMDGFLPELRKQVESRDIATRVYDGRAPQACRYTMEYTANWRWDLAMYLAYTQLQLYERGSLIGLAEYDARSGGGRMDKFGATAEKIEPLIDKMFSNVKTRP